MIAVGGSHLRGKYPSASFVAVTLDANHKVFPIAFAFVEAKRHDGCEWFFANMSLALGERLDLTIVSDRQKCIVPTLANTILSACHCYCCHRLVENIKFDFNNVAIVMKFLYVTEEYWVSEYDAYMEDISVVNVEAYSYIHTFGGNIGQIHLLKAGYIACLLEMPPNAQRVCLKTLECFL